MTLQRLSYTDSGTTGVLMRGNMPLCVTIEPPWKNNEVGKSCIPVGTYNVHPHSGAKFKNVWEVEVPGRDAILFHAGNSIYDTTGCILVGRSFNSFTIKDSRNALEYLRTVLPDNFKLIVRDLESKNVNKFVSFFKNLMKGKTND